MWIFIWLILSAFILGIFFWSLFILYQQKSTWKTFAKKAKLKYESGPLFSSPKVTGVLAGQKVSLFSDSRATPDIRGERFVTIINIELGPGMPTGAAIGTAQFEAMLENVDFKQSYYPDDDFKKENYIVRARDVNILKTYMTDDRIKVMKTLFAMKNANVLLFFDELEAILHVETTDPLRNADHLEKIMKRLLAASKKLLIEEHKEGALSDG